MSKRSILISSCLVGVNCRYDGGHCYSEHVAKLQQSIKLVPICPEVMGGLETPRSPQEIQSDGRIITRDGIDVTAQFKLGARLSLETAKEHGCDVAIFKSKSPSCGRGEIYDGTFSGKLIPGNGVTTNLLLQNGIRVYTENELDQIQFE